MWIACFLLLHLAMTEKLLDGNGVVKNQIKHLLTDKIILPYRTGYHKEAPWRSPVRYCQVLSGYGKNNFLLIRLTICSSCVRYVLLAYDMLIRLTICSSSCSFGLRYVSWYKYLIVSLVFSHLGFWSGNLFLIAPFPDLCLLLPFGWLNYCFKSHSTISHTEM